MATLNMLQPQAVANQRFSFQADTDSVTIRIKTMQDLKGLFIDVSINDNDILLGVCPKNGVNVLKDIQHLLTNYNLKSLFFVQNNSKENMEYTDLGSSVNIYYSNTYTDTQTANMEAAAPTVPDSGGSSSGGGSDMPVKWEDIENKPVFGALAYLNRINLSDTAVIEGVLAALNGGNGHVYGSNSAVEKSDYSFMGMELKAYTTAEFVEDMLNKDVITDKGATKGWVEKSNDSFCITDLPFNKAMLEAYKESDSTIRLKAINALAIGENSTATSVVTITTASATATPWAVIS